MANEPYITRKDLEDVTQKVAIQNSKDIAKPLVDQQKNNDLKELERSIEQKALFQDIADGIRGLGDSLLKGLKDLIPKTDGGLSKLLGLGLGLLLAPFAAFIGFIGQLGVELRFFNKLVGGRLSAFFKPIRDFFTKNKFIQKVVATFKNLFSSKKGFFGKLMNFIKAIGKFATAGPFKAIMKFAGSIGRILGKVFLPITILMSIFDFVKGFMRGYKEGGIIEGIKQGIMDVFDGLVGGLLRILMWIPTKIAEFLGLDKFAKQLGKYTETFIQSIKDIFGGLVDLVVGIFTWDTQKMKGAFTDIWNGIVELIKAPFLLIGTFVEDIFDIDLDESLKPLNDAIDGVLNFFNDIGEKIADMVGLPKIKRKTPNVFPGPSNPNGIHLKHDLENATPLQDLLLKPKPNQGLPPMREDSVIPPQTTNNIFNNYHFNTNNNLSTNALNHASK